MGGTIRLLEQLLIVRHGQTEWSASGRHTGTTDLDLTEDGEIEARSLTAQLAEAIGIEQPQVFSSPRQRALRTVDLTIGSVPFVIDQDLAEWDYGGYEGMTTDEIAELRPGWDIYRDGCPGGETLDDVARRADRFLARAASAGTTVVASTHGHVSRVLTARALGLPAAHAHALYNDTASLAIVRWRRASAVLAGWNIRPGGATRSTG